MDDRTRQTADDLVSHLAPLEGTAKAMFGGYCVYVDEKVVGLVNDGRIFVKITPATKALDGWADQAPAYPGAKDSWRLPADSLVADPDRVVEAFRVTAAALPAKRPRKR
jgi:TfoX/Sxy family transcriptional regulator of competence genes